MEESIQNIRIRNFHISQLSNKNLRFFNYLIDIIIILVIYFIYILVISSNYQYNNSSNDSSHFNIAFIIIYSLYYLIFESIDGKTIGKYITKTRVLTEDGLKPEFMTILGRTLSRLVPFEAFSVLVGDPIGWHDSWSGTIVIPDYILIEPKEIGTDETERNNTTKESTTNENPEEKIQKYSKDISEIPNYAEKYFNRGTAYYNAKKYKEAINDLNKALELNPEYPEAYYNLSILYSEINNTTEAIKSMTQYLNLKKDDETAYNNLGYLYIEDNKYDLAENNFNKSLEIDNNHIDAIVGLIIIYYEKKDIEKLMTFLKLAQKIEPTLKDGKIGITELENKGFYWSDNSKSKLEKILELFK